MNLKKGLVAAALGAGVAVSATACGPGYAQAEYCVDNAGHVMPANYCQPSYPGYGSYFVFYGSLHGHSYTTGQIIPRSYISGGRQYRANDTVGRQKAGIPVTSSFTNGAKPSAPAKAQTAPKSTAVKPPSTSTTQKSTTVRPPSTTVNRSTPRSSGGFSSSRSSGRR